MNNTLKPAVREICRNPRDAAFLKESHDAAFFEASGPLGSYFEKNNVSRFGVGKFYNKI